MEPTQCSETSVFNTQTPGKYPEDNLSLLQHGERLKSRIWIHIYLEADPCGRAVCGRSLAGIVGSNPAGDMDVPLLCTLCVAS